MTVSILNLNAQFAALRQELTSAVLSVLESGRFVLGPNVQNLERELAAYLRVEHAVAVASGTDALHLALRAVGVGPGDLVVTSPFTFIASATSIVCAGARPVFADIHPGTFNLDPDRVKECLAGHGPRGLPAGRVAAIVPVHLYGLPAEMDALSALATSVGAAVVEDAAQAIGAEYRGKRVGGLGDVGCFSFYPTKNLGGMGDGGMAVTQDSAIAEKLLSLRVYGGRERYRHDEIGYNSRLDEVQAAVLRVKLRWLDKWTARRHAIAERYRAGLAGAGVQLPMTPPGSVHVFHQFTIRVADRDGVQRRMAERGVQTAVFYPIPLHLQPAFKDLGYRPGDFPEAERAAREVLCLPIYAELTDGEVDEVIDACLKSL
ncbi:MAG TPA: DegT/DnrJ/EryC1/StrS family aminotransferase [Candidatus Baltobacteraceae bacterium]|nr:DegT/DnrJ/EryC1/StrS family aminotransferase [Candidatus Baltobacteraceae bacterium]